MIESGYNKYIESQNIRVFPCAYRGYYDDMGSNSRVFDPESRATTESNFTNTFHKVSANKDSYVVSWDIGNGTNTTLKCVIGGYYFEIYNQKIQDFFYESSGFIYPYNLCIKVIDQDLSSDPTYDGSRKTNVLSSFEGTNTYLDLQKGAQYVFTGLNLLRASNTPGVTASLLPFKATKLENGTFEYSINPAAVSVLSVLDVGEGNYSIRMIEDDAGDQFNTTIANGDYAIALGKHTEANGLASTALGDNSKATAEAAFAFIKESQATDKYAIAGGDHAIASAESAIALGSNTKAIAPNQIVLGTYNKEDSNQLFILANGTSARGTTANKFTVDYSGNIKALGSLETRGNISATGANRTNNLVLGSTTANSSGALKIYGTGSTEVFTVSNAGATNIAGILSIVNDTQSTATSGGALRVAGGVGIKKAVNIGGNLAVGGNSTFKGTLDVAANKATTLGGTLTVSKSTTLDGTLTVSGTNAASIGGGFTVGGDTSLNGNLAVAAGKTSTLGGQLAVMADTEADGTNAALSVIGGATINKNLNVGTSVVINGTAKANSKDTGALVVKGGVGIDGDIHLSGAVYSPKGVIVTSGGATITGDTAMEKLSVSGGTSISNNEGSTSTDSGALVVSGGVGIGENLNVGGALNLTGAFTVDEAVTIKGETTISATTDSSTTTTGALRVSGGVGIAKQLRVGGTVNIGGHASIAQNLTVSGNNDAPNTLILGSSGTSNKGGRLMIYGTQSTTVAEIENTGDTTIAGTLYTGGKLTTGSEAEIGGKLTVDAQVEISKTGISGISKLEVEGPVEGHYFNATSYNTTSDIRKKCNIEDYKFSESILNLPIKQFEYLGDSTHTKYVGCIAQDLQKICPEFVTEAADGMLTIQESKLIYALLQEVRDLKEKVEMLERR